MREPSASPLRSRAPALARPALAPLALLALLGCRDKGGADDSGGTGGGDGGATAVSGDLSVAFTSPGAGAVYTDDTSLSVGIQVTDDLGGAVDGLALSWSGDVLDGAAPPELTLADGTASFDLPTLSWGIHTLAVQVRRADGDLALASVAFEVVNPDADFDGYDDELWGGEDCDDGDPTINPAGEEYCDGQDNDCNGEIDGADAVDVKTWYEDLDLDGYGVTDLVIVSCQEPKDYVLLSGDCDDTDDAIHPGAAEVCDEVDNDCDALTDDADPGLQTASASAWYPDTDLDGYGDYSAYTLACVQPEGAVDVGGDCDDGDPAVSPAAPEYCDGLDNNCRDGVDEEGAVDASTWYADADEDDWGVEDETVQACDEPEGYAADPGDCEDGDEAVNPDAQEVCNDGVDNDCDGQWQGCLGDALSTGHLLLGDAALDEAGYSVAWLGDLDGDGVDDLWVGARNADPDLEDAGKAYLVLGPVDGERSLADAATTTVVGEDASGRVGRTVAGGRDATGDGTPDLLVAGPGTDDWTSGAGVVALVSGVDALAGGEQPVGDAHHLFVGAETFGYLGIGLALEDHTGDGAADLLLGAPNVDVGGSNAGAVYLFHGPIAAGETDLRDATWDARILGEAGGDEMGQYIEARADLDGDGSPDLALGAPDSSTGSSTAGAVFLLSGPVAGELDLADADATLWGDASGDQLGSATRWVGDVDLDGRDDLVLGAPTNDAGGLSAGAAYLVLGVADLSDLDGQTASEAATWVVLGADSGGQLGQDAAGDGDHDGDGVDDLLLGAPYGGPEGQGAVLLFLGPLAADTTGAEADATWAGDATTGGLGVRVGYAGDAAGGDTDALLLPMRGADLTGADAGGVALVPETGL
ncbi:hypothetical protein L6R53_10785 [Myxococcota bacterium]|nr:hypothetical protein [Myxococcota bacterium]